MRTERQIAAHRMKYAGQGGGPRCKVCGGPTDSILLRCESCSEKLFMPEELRRTEEWLRLHPDTQIELAQDKKKLAHLVMYRFPTLSWCNQKLSQKRENRVTATAGHFPPGCCPACLLVYEGMGL